jgi:hypothetical protein
VENEFIKKQANIGIAAHVSGRTGELPELAVPVEWDKQGESV